MLLVRIVMVMMTKRPHSRFCDAMSLLLLFSQPVQLFEDLKRFCVFLSCELFTPGKFVRVGLTYPKCSK